MKVDRQEIFGCVVALREWLAMDHEARLQGYGERIEVLLADLSGLPGVEAYSISARETPHPTIRDGVRIVLESAESAERAVESLKQGEPCIWTRSDGSAINVSVAYLHDADVEVVARRLREVL